MTEPTPWPLWSDQHLPTEPPDPAVAAASAPSPACPACGRGVPTDAVFCEACGAPLMPSAAGTPDAAPARVLTSAQTRRLGSHTSTATRCAHCGGTVDSDGYCQTCGAKAPSARDHFESAPSAWVGGVCDRGITHHRNEDAMALWVDPAGGTRAVLVVCDGVSSSTDSDVASLAAAERARDVLAVAKPRGLGTASEEAAMTAALVGACAQANEAVIENSASDSPNPASATFAAAVVDGHSIHFANLGDSRIYWIAEDTALQLSHDDSVAQAFIDQGMPKDEAEALRHGHAITKWLGRDADDVVPRTGVLPLSADGWLVVCSDGLWNYASEPEDLARQLAAASRENQEPIAVARLLVAWANAQGGRDNITVALARCRARLDGTSTTPTSSLPRPEGGI